MTKVIRFIPSEYPGGRILLMCGQVQAGAVFPPAGSEPGANHWVWRLWIGGATTTPQGRAKSELAAKNALRNALAEFLRRAGLEAAA